MIYFVKADKFIKIGCTNRPIQKRLTALRQEVPWYVTPTPHETPPLELLFTLPGQKQLEKQFHTCFSQYRVRVAGEWFRYEGQLRRYVQKMLRAHI